jgi:hypothetical protein
MGDGRDVRGRRSDGTVFPLEIGLSPIGRGADATTLAAMVDLSARQASQDQLAAALREKTILLDEVHHRVKNNLQVITSLLSLQSRGAPPEARAALAECRNRVHAMALTHQLLHENNDVARLHVGQYLIRLTRLLADSHRSAAGMVTLRVEGADTPLYLDLPRAIPCGLLVNELAPRPHNRGHSTIDACVTSQFEQQVRVLAGVPLGDTSLHSPVVMVNILGDAWLHAGGEPDWSIVLGHPRAKLHLYGKETARPGRKMGHLFRQ